MVNIFRYVRCLVWRPWQASSIATPEAKKWHTEDSGIPWSTQQDKPSVKPDESNECIKSTCQQVCIMFHDFMTWKSPVFDWVVMNSSMPFEHVAVYSPLLMAECSKLVQLFIDMYMHQFLVNSYISFFDKIIFINHIFKLAFAVIVLQNNKKLLSAFHHNQMHSWAALHTV